MKAKSRVDLLRQALAATDEVTTEHLAEVARLCGAMGRQANDELARRINEQRAAQRQAEHERRTRLAAEGEERRRAQAKADAAAAVDATERQRQRDDEEEKQARAMIEAAGLKPEPAFSHPR